MSKNFEYTVIDLFCGAGGLSYGFEKAGFNIVAGFDNCKDSLETFKKNHHNAVAVSCDLSFSIPNIDKYKGVNIVIGGPPCQGFSISGKRDPNDRRNELYNVYISTLKALEPKIFLMENVPNLVAMDKGKIKEKIINDLKNLGYYVTYKILNASAYGVPQNRRRVFIIGSKEKHIILPETMNIKNQVTCEEAISDLPDVTINDGENYTHAANSKYQELMRENSSGVWNHQITKHTEKTIKIISLVPNGGNYKDLPENLRETRKVNIAWTRYNSNKPSHTIDTGHRHHFHYSYNRVPTVRESARLQSFPDSFIFSGSKTSQYRQVGNAVPPLMAKEVASFLREEII